MVQQITAIEPQQKNPQRVNIYLDGEFAFGLTSLLAAWLKVGQELSDEKIASLKAGDELEVTYQKALHFLSYRPRSAEVRQNLMKRGIAEPLVEETLSRLQAPAWLTTRLSPKHGLKTATLSAHAVNRPCGWSCGAKVSVKRSSSLFWIHK